MTRTITDISMVTPEWLTGVLRENRALEEGHVVEIEHSASESFNAHHYRLQVTYSPSSEDAPTDLFLKLTKADKLPSNDREVRFYTDIAPMMPNAYVPRCYDAHYDSVSGAYHVLLEDLSISHRPVKFPLPPTWQQTELMVDALAQLHSFWWDHPHIQTKIVPEPPSELVHRYTREMTSEYEELLGLLGESLTVDRRSIFEESFASFPNLAVERLERKEHLTFVHGDAHVWNFLVPKEPRDSSIYLIDWHTLDWYLQCNMGVSDLAYMMIHNWFPDHRRRHETNVLRLYHEKLAAYGVANYTWEMLWWDYRLAALNSLYIVAQWGGWSPAAMTICMQLENTMAAFEDLNCRELLS